MGWKLLRDPDIRAEIDSRVTRLTEDAWIRAERVLAELAAIAFSDMGDYMRFEQDGRVVLDWSNLQPPARRAIAEVTQEEHIDRGDGAPRAVRRTKFKLHDKLGALDKLGRYYGLFNVDGAASQQPPAAPDSSLSPAEIQAKVREILLAASPEVSF
jgi:phage terminase small subunit